MSIQKFMKNGVSFLSKHPEYNATIHALGGLGVGILIASPMAHPHPVRWGVVFLLLSVAGHIYAGFAKK